MEALTREAFDRLKVVVSGASATQPDTRSRVTGRV
jgi:hypothetical protein